MGPVPPGFSRRALGIVNWDFLPLLDEPFADVKAVIFHQPVRNERLLRKIPQCAAALVAAAP